MTQTTTQAQSPTTLNMGVSQSILKKVPRFFGSPQSILTELFQNSFRAGAKTVTVTLPYPPHLSAIPQTIDPDRWLLLQTGKTYTRRLGRDGCFQLGNQTYYVQQKLHGRSVTIWVDGRQRELGIFIDGRVIKKLPIKGLQNRMMAFDDFVDWMAKEAESAWRRYIRRTPTYTRGSM